MTDADKTTYNQLVYPALGACQEVHKHLGPFLNEYMYQDALAIELSLHGIPFDKEYLFTADYKGHTIEHRHFADFRIMNGDTPILIECKAVDNLTDAHRQQLWNYMRLTSTRIGILYNFAPVKDECERYYLDATTGMMYAF